VDSAPTLTYFIPHLGAAGYGVVSMINDRSLNLEVFEGVEETTVDPTPQSATNLHAAQIRISAGLDEPQQP
jgi:hypothetical protein